MKRATCGSIIATFVLILAGCGGAGSGSAGGATPEATFEKFKTAMKSKDFKTGYAQLTPESQEMMLGSMSMMLGLMAAMDQEKGPALQKILDKHGVKKMNMMQMGANLDAKAAMKEAAGGVKDKPACIAEIMTWMEANSPNKQQGAKDFDEMADAVLVDVKTEGDSATGTIKPKSGGGEKSQPAMFKKVGGLWFIDMTEMDAKAPAAGPPQFDLPGGLPPGAK